MKKEGRTALPKLCGADVELGNFVLGLQRAEGTGAEAARALLAHVQGVADRRNWRLGVDLGDGGAPPDGPAATSAPAPGALLPENNRFDPQDWGRKYLATNGGCVYIDLNHLELCLPEVLSAWDHVACWRAMLGVAREAQRAANARLGNGASIKVLVNNSDGLGNSYGSHINVLVTRQTWERLFHRKLQYGLFLATHQITSILFTGQGKVGSENGAPAVEFQLAQRADFFETLSGPQTTFQRPILNTRDEPLAGSNRSAAAGPARVHVIFYDSNLCDVASLLKIGTLQIVLAMLEAGELDLKLILDDPVAAVVDVSHDLTLKATVETLSGERMTALDIQWLILERAVRFVQAGRCEGIVPRAEEIVALWQDTLARLEAGDFATLARRLDWVLKLSLLDRVRRERGIDGWGSPVLKHLDQLYSSLDPEDGLFCACESAGLIERVVEPERVAHFMREAPEDTRAWGRSQLLRRLRPFDIEDIDWDLLRVRSRKGQRQIRLAMSDPLGFTRREVEPLLERSAAPEELLVALGGEEGLVPVASQVFGAGGSGYWPACVSSAVSVFKAAATAVTGAGEGEEPSGVDGNGRAN